MTRLERTLERHGGACVWCGRQPWQRDMTVEHLLPRSRGGRGTPENLAPACRRCNRRRGSRPVAAFAREQLAQGEIVDLERIRHALIRLAASPLRHHAEYGARQLELVTGYTPTLQRT